MEGVWLDENAYRNYVDVFDVKFPDNTEAVQVVRRQFQLEAVNLGPF